MPGQPTFNGMGSGNPQGVVAGPRVTSGAVLTAHSQQPKLLVSTNTAGDATFQLMDYALIPAGTLTADFLIRWHWAMGCINSANTKIIRPFIGNSLATLIGVGSGAFQSTITYATFFRMLYGNDNLATVGGVFGSGISDNAAQTSVAPTNLTLDLTQDIYLAMQGAWGAATVGEVLTLRNWLIEVFP